METAEEFSAFKAKAKQALIGPEPVRKALVLCFDGTGNKFQGNTGDSNIIKIYSMLDRQNPFHHTYYQPGIGTYVESSAFTKTSHLAKFKSWYMKAKDQAVGTSFDAHVMAAYKFLMRYYSDGDDIYFFGFSRGAYTARFLAQMLDYVGLLSAGNEEMMRFAWKIFAQWQTRLEGTEEEKKKKKETFEFMKGFRETFSRPTSRIRFLGLFDTVNSVPRFETAWMQRTKFPYTARSSARVIRHAVSIDERRAKFRQDLISEQAPQQAAHLRHHHMRHFSMWPGKEGEENSTPARPEPARDPGVMEGRFRHQRHAHLEVNGAPRHQGAPSAVSSKVSISHASISSTGSQQIVLEKLDDEMAEDEDAGQDIKEVWFPGCHADIGGGWPIAGEEKVSLSLGPFLWMLREARNAGLPFNEAALRDSNYILDEPLDDPDPEPPQTFHAPAEHPADIPSIQLDGHDMPTSPPAKRQDQSRPAPLPAAGQSRRETFLQKLHLAATAGTIHDSLVFNRGTPTGGVLSWRVMEYLPFRRMDLQPDGSWKPIRWPLPCGETRDVPADAIIHNSVLRRMEADESYRPGNLIVGGGGRGMRKAPEHLGKGTWKVVREKGDAIGEVLTREGEAGKV